MDEYFDGMREPRSPSPLIAGMVTRIANCLRYAKNG